MTAARPAKRRQGTPRGRPDQEASSRETLRHDGKHWLVAADDAGTRSPGLGLVPALDKAISIIEYVNLQNEDATTLANISSALGISKSHCHSILKTLQERGWLRFDENAKSYTLHPGLLGSVSNLLAVPEIDIIRREITDLVSEVRFPCVLSQPMADDTFMLVDKFHNPLQMEVSLPIGYRYPRDASAQMRAFLAWAPEERVAAWLKEWKPVKYTAATPITPSAVRAELAETRRRGYARSRGEFTEGLMALALPIFNRQGEVDFILNCSAPIEAMASVEISVAEAMGAATKHIHQQILGKVPEGFGAIDAS